MSQSNLKINSVNKETMEVLDQIQILLSHFDTETCQNNLGYIYWSYPLKNTAVHLQSQVLICHYERHLSAYRCIDQSSFKGRETSWAGK